MEDAPNVIASVATPGIRSGNGVPLLFPNAGSTSVSVRTRSG